MTTLDDMSFSTDEFRDVLTITTTEQYHNDDGENYDIEEQVVISTNGIITSVLLDLQLNKAQLDKLIDFLTNKVDRSRLPE